ncbi:MAG TPA: hypothetical protein VKP30_09450 [Polyangiaceae bacterium]|nr:hypothetical protein [Polyangiaceae bacterium]
MRNSSHDSRANQKERTRQALIEAARDLIASGIAPTVAGTAEHAAISVATAYRYYSDSQSLIRDALASNWPDLAAVRQAIRATPKVTERARKAAEALARTILTNEVAVRAVIASSYTAATTQGQTHGTFRPAFRTGLIDDVLGAVSPRVGAPARRELRLALLTVVSAEAVLALKDMAECDDDEIVRTLGKIAARVVDDRAHSPSRATDRSGRAAASRRVSRRSE